MSNEDGFFSSLSPQASFAIGVGGGLLILFTIGFFVLLGIYLNGTAFSGSGSENKPAVAENNQQQEKKGQKQAQQQGSTEINMAEVTDDDWQRGAEDPKVVIVEYSDLECPFCKQFHDTMKQVVNEYGNEVQWVFRHAPLKQLHSKAPEEALAAECAGRVAGEDKFWEFTDKIFSVTPSNNGLDLDKLPDYAEDVGINRTEFENCMENDKYQSEVEEELADAKSAGLRGTPYSVAIGPDGEKTPISGAQPFSKVELIIESML